MLVKLRHPRGSITQAEVTFMDESIQPPGYPFVAAIRFPQLELPYIVANEAGHVMDVMAWDEDGSAIGQIEDEWDEKPFDEAGFEKFVLTLAANQDPRDMVKAMRNR